MRVVAQVIDLAPEWDAPPAETAIQPPGAQLAARLEAVADISSCRSPGTVLDDAALLAAIVDAHRMASWAQAIEIQLIAWFAARRLAGPVGETLREHEVSRWAADGLACALTLTARWWGEPRRADDDDDQAPA